MTLNKNYWEDRYKSNETGWDVGSITTPLKEYIDQIQDKNLKILIPGAGNGYEVDYLTEKGFTNVFVIDFGRSPSTKHTGAKSEFPERKPHSKRFFRTERYFRPYSGTNVFLCPKS